MPGPAPCVIFALQNVRDAAAEFDDFEPALHVALRIGDHLAMFGREHVRQFVHVRLDQAFEIEHHARAPLRIGRGPAGLRLQRRGDRDIQIGTRPQRHLRLDRPGVGIEDVGLTPVRHAAAAACMADDMMVDDAHRALLLPEPSRDSAL